MTTRDHAIEIRLEVPFHDVDALRIVWHGHYLKYLELARTLRIPHNCQNPKTS